MLHKSKRTEYVDDPNPIDIHVGKRLKQRRTQLGFTQEKLAQAVELTFQQVQKYERGINRIGASRLYQLSQVLKISVSYFFEGYSLEGLPPPNLLSFSETSSPSYGADSPVPVEILEITQAFSKISDLKIRQGVLDLIRTLSMKKEM
jgi:transcriptional regulator with XRE-family HTH domain